MNQHSYETVIILTPVLSEAQMKEAVKGYRELITEHSGEIIHEDNWGLTKLAYPISKKTTGFYHLIEFKANPEFIKVIDLAYRRDERIMRFMIVKLDKHAVIYNDRRRKGEIGKPKVKVEEAAAV